MGTIEISVDTSANASIFTVRGEVTVDDVIEAMNRQYVEGAPPHAIWDYSGANFYQIDADGFQRIANAAMDRARYRPGGKTSFVAPGDNEAIAIKLLQATSHVIDLPIPLQVHQTREEALSWLTGA